MKKYYTGLAFIGLAILASSCQKTFETYPVERFTEDRVFDKQDSLGTKAYGYLNNIYAVMRNGHNGVSGDYLDAASDDAVSSVAATGSTVTLLSTGKYNSGTFEDVINSSNDNVWARYYAGIRLANTFITNIDAVPVQATIPNLPGVSFKYGWKNEARFLRAYFYFELVKRYGGVPLMGDKVYQFDENVNLSRNSFEDCVNYIVKECDAIKDTLLAPRVSNDVYGRVTQGAALALKAKVLLYAASPLFNGGNIDGSNPLTGYTSVDNTRWAKAAAAAKAVMDMGKYSLADNFSDVFATQNTAEIIFFRQGSRGTSIEGSNAPIGYTQAVGLGRTSPTQDLVDAYPMLNGANINASGSGYNASTPYANRDPRLALTVFYNGHRWLSNDLQLYEGGISKPNNGRQQTVSGYYMRKFMDKAEETNAFVTHPQDWLIFRYAEIMLDYAEAENEVNGPSADVYQQVIDIRKRAGIEAGADNTYGLQPLAAISKDSLRNAIRNERRLELAFEENRFFDIRRWKIAGDGQSVMSKARRGVSITKVGTNLTFNYGPVLPTIFPPASAFTANMYFYPIPYDEVNRNPNMKQNPGWN